MQYAIKNIIIISNNATDHIFARKARRPRKFGETVSQSHILRFCMSLIEQEMSRAAPSGETTKFIQKHPRTTTISYVETLQDAECICAGVFVCDKTKRVRYLL